MGKIYETTITTNDRNIRISDMVAFINSLDGVTAEAVTLSAVTYTGVKFNFTNYPIEGFFGYEVSGGLYYTGTYLKNTDTNYNYIYVFNRGGTANEPVSIYAYVDENCTMLAVHDLYNGHTGIECFVLNTTNNKSLVGYRELINQGGIKYVDINTLIFQDIDDTSHNQLVYTNMFPYIASAGTIDFLTKGFFVDYSSPYYKKFETDALRECSTVTLLTTQSLAEGNCIALGAHCLAPLDEEE